MHTEADQLLRRNKRTREKLDLNIAAYQRAFGLSVSTVSPSTMQFEFDHIDPRDPRRKFVVTIVENDEKHRAGDCRPMIAGFEALGRELDLTNKLEPFLLAVRKGFQALVAQ